MTDYYIDPSIASPGGAGTFEYPYKDWDEVGFWVIPVTAIVRAE